MRSVRHQVRIMLKMASEILADWEWILETRQMNFDSFLVFEAGM